MPHSKSFEERKPTFAVEASQIERLLLGYCIGDIVGDFSAAALVFTTTALGGLPCGVALMLSSGPFLMGGTIRGRASGCRVAPVVGGTAMDQAIDSAVALARQTKHPMSLGFFAGVWESSLTRIPGSAIKLLLFALDGVPTAIAHARAFHAQEGTYKFRLFYTAKDIANQTTILISDEEREKVRDLVRRPGRSFLRIRNQKETIPGRPLPHMPLL